jgi:hypothetical protein
MVGGGRKPYTTYTHVVHVYYNILFRVNNIYIFFTNTRGGVGGG